MAPASIALLLLPMARQNIIVGRFVRYRSFFDMQRSTAEIGQAGEAFARQYLIDAGYRIVGQNWRVRGGELDIVAVDSESLVFVEVRARAIRGPVAAESTVDGRKLSRIMLAADDFLQNHGEFVDSVWRVDLIAITMDHMGSVQGLDHYRNLTLD
jgi:putative endonuclease